MYGPKLMGEKKKLYDTVKTLSTFPGQLVALPFGCDEGVSRRVTEAVEQQEYRSKPGNENSTITVNYSVCMEQ
jgi:hypothetical protein